MHSHNFYTYVLKCIFKKSIYLEFIVADLCEIKMENPNFLIY